MFALIAGAATGAVLGILFAPDKGEETREKIKKAASEGYDSLKDITEEKAHELHVRARYARKEMNALKKTLREQLLRKMQKRRSLTSSTVWRKPFQRKRKSSTSRIL